MPDLVGPAAPLGSVSLSEAIEGLRGELLVAWGSSSQSPLRFKPSPVELTLTVTVTSDKSAKGGVKWWLLEAGGDLSRGLSATHTVKLTLDPVAVDADGQPIEFLVSDKDDPGPASRTPTGETPDAGLSDPE